MHDFLHTMCAGRSCHYAGTQSSAPRSQQKPENKQHSILPPERRAHGEGIMSIVNNHRGEVPGMLRNVGTKIQSCTSPGHCWEVNTSQAHSELFICGEAQDQKAVS